MKVSVVTTVQNEEQTIAKLLDSLLSQTKKADEVVIVDGGSTDSTVRIIKNYQRGAEQIRLVIEKGTIAHGRNVAVDNARFKIIAMVDAGCIAKEDWLEKIAKPFTRKGADVVAGFYLMTGDSPMQKAVAPFLGISPQRYDRNSFLPSARSMAFTKTIWEKVGGFSEIFSRAGEDTHFNYKIVKKGGSMIRVKDAIVYWEVPHTFSENLKKFYYYAKGDAQSGILWQPIQGRTTHTLKIVTILARYAVGVLVLFFAFFTPQLFLLLSFGFVLYLLWAIFKVRNVVKDSRARLWLPIIQVSSDFAVMVGFLSGVIKR